MSRRRRSADEEDRQALLDAAGRLVGAGHGELVVIVARGELVTVRAEVPQARPSQTPEGMAEYDAAILRALTDRPLSSQQLARRAGHRHNSYFRSRLAAIVEAGHIRHTRRGYVPGK